MDLFEHADANPPKMTAYTRRMEIEDAAKKYNEKFPKVMELFDHFTSGLIRRGFKHYGASQIFGRIRWETDTPDVDGMSTFKINSNYCPHYARWWMEENPAHDGFFRTRHLKSDDEPALGLPELGPEDFPTINEPSGTTP